jgi:hypothetical protein
MRSVVWLSWLGREPSPSVLVVPVVEVVLELLLNFCFSAASDAEWRAKALLVRCPTLSLCKKKENTSQEK